jgi:hypothetical protein
MSAEFSSFATTMIKHRVGLISVLGFLSDECDEHKLEILI